MRNHIDVARIKAGREQMGCMSPKYSFLGWRDGLNSKLSFPFCPFEICLKIQHTKTKQNSRKRFWMWYDDKMPYFVCLDRRRANCLLLVLFYMNKIFILFHKPKSNTQCLSCILPPQCFNQWINICSINYIKT